MSMDQALTCTQALLACEGGKGMKPIFLPSQSQVQHRSAFESLSGILSQCQKLAAGLQKNLNKP